MRVSKLLLGFSFAFAFVLCVAGSVPAFAACYDQCAKKCSGSFQPPVCMNKCAAACKAKDK